MVMKMKTNCPNCGAPIDYSKEKCEYCGTYYERDDSKCVVLYSNNKPVLKIPNTEFSQFLTYNEKRKFFILPEVENEVSD